MFNLWLENLQMLVSEIEGLASLVEWKRLFESGLSEIDAWAFVTGEVITVD